MTIQSVPDFANALCAALGIDLNVRHITSLTLTCAVDELPLLKLTEQIIPDDNDFTELHEVITTHVIIPVREINNHTQEHTA